jgi:hypothetical protein
LAHLVWGAGATLLAVATSLPARTPPTRTPPAEKPIDLRRRVEDSRPFDGQGRYALATEDGVRGCQALAVLAGRFGAKPYDALSTGKGAWLTERVIFKDVDTGATVMRLTNDRWATALSYFHGSWSADGKTIVFRRRPGMWEASTPTHGPMAMNADGTNLRNVFRDHKTVTGEVCSPTEPDVAYAKADGRSVAFSLGTGLTDHLVHGSSGWHLKISPDGRYLLSWGDTSRGKGLWVARVDGKEKYEIAVPESIHDSYRFHPTLPKVLFWYEGKLRDGFVQCDFDGSHQAVVPVSFDWNHADVGPDRGVHGNGTITRIRGEAWLPFEPLFAPPGREYYDDPYNFNSYVSWAPKDEPWANFTRIARRPHVSEIFTAAVEPAPDHAVNRYRVCLTGLQPGRDLDNPNTSPDGTKVLFNSNLFGQVDIFLVVARLPESPQGLTVRRSGAGNELTWEAPRHHAEVAGYHVYRSRCSGRGFQTLTAPHACVPAGKAGLRYLDPVEDSATYYYVVTAVENSGLESGLSDEVVSGRAGRYQGVREKRTVFLEAERARLTHPFWVGFRGDASDLHYIWMRQKEGTGTATFALSPAQLIGGPCRLWARVKGEGGARFTVGAGKARVALRCEPSKSWQWVRADETIDLAGQQSLEVSGSAYGSSLDCLALSTDDDFDPGRAARVVWPPLAAPSGLAVRARSPHEAFLAWRDGGDAVHHYNVYCGPGETFEPNQTYLVASPDRPRLVDWGIRGGQQLYYRVTAVDRAGNESPGCAPVAVQMPEVRRTLLMQEFAEAIEFTVPQEGRYTIWLELVRGKGRGTYIDLKMDDKVMGAWVGALDGLSDVAWLNYDRWGRAALTAGKHTLSISNKSPHKINKVLITNDEWYRPAGHVAILAGW